jgi:hypothetical protein
MSRYPIRDNVNQAAGRAVSAGTTALVMVPIYQRNRTAVISVVEKETDPSRTTGKSASRSAAVSIAVKKVLTAPFRGLCSVEARSGKADRSVVADGSASGREPPRRNS